MEFRHGTIAECITPGVRREEAEDGSDRLRIIRRVRVMHSSDSGRVRQGRTTAWLKADNDQSTPL